MTDTIESLRAAKVALYAEIKKIREENEALQKQKIYLQQQCRKAGVAIVSQELANKDLKKEIDRLSEEYENYKTIRESK